MGEIFCGLKAHYMLAQGIALGKLAFSHFALKGQYNPVFPFILPFQGAGFSPIFFPRALPWARLYRAFSPQVIHSNRFSMISIESIQKRNYDLRTFIRNS
jgi:hypothetical protein